MDGPLRYNITDSHQDNWMNQHNNKKKTSPHGNNYHTNVGYTVFGVGGDGLGVVVTEILRQRSLEYIRSH